MNNKQKKVGLFWIITMLIMLVNGIVLFNKGRKLKINFLTISGIVITLINILAPTVIIITSNDDLMAAATLLWLISPIVALVIAISKRKEYIEKMTMVNFAKANNLQYKNIDELTENYNKYIGKDNRTESEKWEDIAKKKSNVSESKTEVIADEKSAIISEDDSVKKEKVVEEKIQDDEPKNPEATPDDEKEVKVSKLEDRLKKLK